MERCAEQVDIIRGSFYAKKLNQHKVSGRELSEKPIAPDELVTAAVEIGELLERKAIRGEGGSASWVGLIYKPSLAAFRYLPLAEDLFEGQAGVGLFLAALAKVTGSEAFRELAGGAMLPLRRFIRFALDDTGWKKANDGKIESALLIYPLVRTGELLNDLSLITLASDAASLVTSELLDRIPDLGLPNGITAIMLGLLALKKVANDDGILKRAILCGDYLLQRKEQPAIGRDLAFRRLCEMTSDARFGEPVERTSLKRWLPGMLGVGLDLLWDRAPCEADSMSEWLEASLQQQCGNELMQLDSVAEGNLGLVELTLEAAERLSRPNLLSLGMRLATKTAVLAKNNGGYRIYSGIPQSAPCFGYLRGVAGIGYTLLRACTPELRSILQWN
jgi:lantibiotic modifying enzyme